MTKLEIREAELQGKEHITKRYEECARSTLLEEIKPHIGLSANLLHPMSLPELTRRRNRIMLGKILIEQLGSGWHDSLVDTLVGIAASRLRMTEAEVTEKYTPAIRVPPLSLEVCRDYIRQEKITVPKNITDFLGGVTTDCPPEEVKKAYDNCVRSVCFLDILEGMKLPISKEECEEDPLGTREKCASHVAKDKVAGYLNHDIRIKFGLCNPQRYDVAPDNDGLFKAFASIGVGADKVTKMLVSARPQLTVIPEFKMITSWVEVAKEKKQEATVTVPVATDRFDQWIDKVTPLIKEKVETALQQGLEVDLILVTRLPGSTTDVVIV